ncbi:MAG: Clp protease ClpP [Clostridium sp.]|nr:Clp protease ClpP [Clostridium sp.]
MNKQYYSLVQENNEATLNIYGDITSWEWYPGDVSSYTLSKQLENIEADVIHVYINSYGGEVAEGLAIYNSLKRHKAKIITHADGFACSIASVIFMAGDERIMSTASLLMIHNAWTYTSGNANELRKQADDLDVITQASVNAYMAEINISEEELKQLLDDETWLSPQSALDMNFCTSIVNEKDTEKASQSVRKSLSKMILELQNEKTNKTQDVNQQINEPEANQQSNNQNENNNDNENEKEPQQNLMGSFFYAILK